MKRRVGLTQEQVLNLIDCLRRQLLYQTPQPVFKSGGSEPDYVLVKMKPLTYSVVMQLIAKAGGWTLPEEAKRELQTTSTERHKFAFGNGKEFNFTGLTLADLYAMYGELGIDDLPDDLTRFRIAIGDEITNRQLEAQIDEGDPI